MTYSIVTIIGTVCVLGFILWLTHEEKEVDKVQTEDSKGDEMISEKHYCIQCRTEISEEDFEQYDGYCSDCYESQDYDVSEEG